MTSWMKNCLNLILIMGLAFGITTSVKNTSLNGDWPEIRVIGFTSTPGDFISRVRKLIPSYLVLRSVRKTPYIQSASSAPDSRVFRNVTGKVPGKRCPVFFRV